MLIADVTFAVEVTVRWKRWLRRTGEIESGGGYLSNQTLSTNLQSSRLNNISGGQRGGCNVERCRWGRGESERQSRTKCKGIRREKLGFSKDRLCCIKQDEQHFVLFVLFIKFPSREDVEKNNLLKLNDLLCWHVSNSSWELWSRESLGCCYALWMIKSCETPWKIQQQQSELKCWQPGVVLWTAEWQCLKHILREALLIHPKLILTQTHTHQGSCKAAWFVF